MSRFSKRHSRTSGSDIHTLVWQEVADTAARLAIVPSSSDQGKLVHQLDNDSFWILADYTVPTWTEITSAGVAAVTSVATRTGDVTLSNTDISGLGTASTHNVGTATGEVVELEDVGGSPGLPAVDGSQLTGIASSGSAVTIQDEGNPLTTDVTLMNFVGAGVTVDEPTPDQVRITIGGGGAPVDSVFSRTGTVTAAADDYAASQVTNDATNTNGNVTGAYVSAALDTADAAIEANQSAAATAQATADTADSKASSAKGKTDFLTVSGSTNLDQMRSDVTANNAKISFDATSSTNVSNNTSKLTEVTTITTAGAALLDDASNTVQRQTLGLGSAATRNVGSTIGTVPELENVGGNPGLPAVDGSQLTGISAGADITIEDDANGELTTSVTKITFTGAGVTATEPVPGSDEIEVNVSGVGSAIDVSDGTTTVSPTDKITFDGNSFNVVDQGLDDALVQPEFGTGNLQIARGNHTHTTLTNLPSGVLVGRDSAGTGTSENLSPTEVRTLLGVTGENGFIDAAGETTLTWLDPGTARTLRLAPVAADFSFYANGIKYTKTGNVDFQIGTQVGLHYCYFDNSGNAQTSVNPDIPTLIVDNCFVCAVYWDGTEALLVMDERHGNVMDSQTHIYNHSTFGARYGTGLAIQNIVADATGDIDTHAQCGLEAGEIWDEDLRHMPSAIAAPASVPIFYRTGAAGDWAKATTTWVTHPLNGGTYPPYNSFNVEAANEWGLTDLADGDYVLTHVFATGDINTPFIYVMGQASYATLADAQAGASIEIRSLQMGGLATLTPEFVAIGTILCHARSQNGNAIKIRVVSTAEGHDYVDWRAASGGGATSTAATSHNGLGDIQGGTAGEYYHMTQSEATAVAELETDSVTLDQVTVTDGSSTTTTWPDGIRTEGASVAITSRVDVNNAATLHTDSAVVTVEGVQKAGIYGGSTGVDDGSVWVTNGTEATTYGPAGITTNETAFTIARRDIEADGTATDANTAHRGLTGEDNPHLIGIGDLEDSFLSELNTVIQDLGTGGGLRNIVLGTDAARQADSLWIGDRFWYTTDLNQWWYDDGISSWVQISTTPTELATKKPVEITNAGIPGASTGNGLDLGTICVDTTNEKAYTLVNNTTDANVWDAGSGGGGGHTIEENGVDMPQQDTLNFSASFDLTDAASKTNVDLALGNIDHNALLNYTATRHRLIQQGTFAGRPAADGSQEYYHATDTQELFWDNAGTWETIYVASHALHDHTNTTLAQLNTKMGDQALVGDLDSRLTDARLATGLAVSGVTLPTTAPAVGQVLKADTTSSLAWGADATGSGGGSSGGTLDEWNCAAVITGTPVSGAFTVNTATLASVTLFTFDPVGASGHNWSNTFNGLAHGGAYVRVYDTADASNWVMYRINEVNGDDYASGGRQWSGGPLSDTQTSDIALTVAHVHTNNAFGFTATNDYAFEFIGITQLRPAISTTFPMYLSNPPTNSYWMAPDSAVPMNWSATATWDQFCHWLTPPTAAEIDAAPGVVVPYTGYGPANRGNLSLDAWLKCPSGLSGQTIRLGLFTARRAHGATDASYSLLSSSPLCWAQHDSMTGNNWYHFQATGYNAVRPGDKVIPGFWRYVGTGTNAWNGEFTCTIW